MNKLLLSLVFISVVEGRTVAQDLKPEPPFIKNATENASWNIEFRPAEAQPSQKSTLQPASQLTASFERELHEIQVDKVGPNRREVYLWSDGEPLERWYYGGLVLIEAPGTRKIMCINQTRMDKFQESVFPKYQSDDFPEFFWVNKSSYKAVEKKSGRICFRYERNGGTLDGSRQNATDIIWIDADTRLPVALQTATEVRTYIFKNARLPSIPSRFLGSYDKYKKAFSLP